MTIKQKLNKLTAEKNEACLTISMNTHRKHPDNAIDVVLLKTLLKEAEDRLIKEFGKRPIALLLTRLAEVGSEIDVNYNLDSLHIFLSNDTKEIIRSTWSINENGVHISNTFNVRSLIKSYNRSEEYYIILLSQSGVHLYNALNDVIIDEVSNDDLPFLENALYETNSDRGSDSKHIDNLVREYFNSVDKAVVKLNNETGLKCVVISTENNFSRLMQIADKPSLYIGHASIDYNDTAKHTIAQQAWEIIKVLQFNRRTDAIEEMKEAVAQGAVLSDLQEIYQASIDGRGDLLIVHQDFSQAVIMTSERTFERISERTANNAIDDITSAIAWAVMSKNGRVFFTTQDEIKELGDIVLKTRY